MKPRGGGSPSTLRFVCLPIETSAETAVDTLSVLRGIVSPWRSGSHAGIDGSHAISMDAAVSTAALRELSLTGAKLGSPFSAGLSSLNKVSKAFS